MRWWAKWGISYALAHLPYGKPLYGRILRRFGELGQIASSSRFENAETLLDMARRHCDGIDRLHAVEIGTGWIPAVPLGFMLAGARVDTFDISRLAADDLFLQTRQTLETRIDGLARASGTAPHILRQRLKDIGQAPAFDAACRILGGSYHAPYDTASLPLADGEADLVISNLVLQCVPRDLLPPLLQEIWRILKPGGVALHRIRMSDEYAPAGSGAGRNHLEYLKYSDESWNRWFNHSLKHLNRLRAPQFMELFARHGFTCLECGRNIDTDSIPFLQQLELAPPFRQMSWEDLATVAIEVALKKVPVP